MQWEYKKKRTGYLDSYLIQQKTAMKQKRREIRVQCNSLSLS
jgi:hypothetical protein